MVPVPSCGLIMPEGCAELVTSRLLVQVQPAAPQLDSARARPRLQGSLGLAPIDHGFCLPEALEPPYFEWLHWPQVCRMGLLLYGMLVGWGACPGAGARLPFIRCACLRSQPETREA